MAVMMAYRDPFVLPMRQDLQAQADRAKAAFARGVPSDHFVLLGAYEAYAVRCVALRCVVLRHCHGRCCGRRHVCIGWRLNAAAVPPNCAGCQAQRSPLGLLQGQLPVGLHAVPDRRDAGPGCGHACTLACAATRACLLRVCRAHLARCVLQVRTGVLASRADVHAFSRNARHTPLVCAVLATGL